MPAPAASYAPPPRPRKRGPLLFGPTLALLALSLGVLGMVDVSGVDVPASAYAALATAVCGAMLLLGAFFGRAGGVILLGLLSAATLAVTAAVEHADNNVVTRRPTLAADVQDHYAVGAGKLVVDLSAVTDPENLDGRSIGVEQGAGRVIVIVPDDVDVRATGYVGGPGQVTVFEETGEGVDVTVRNTLDAPAEVAGLTIKAELGIGRVDIVTEGEDLS